MFTITQRNVKNNTIYNIHVTLYNKNNIMMPKASVSVVVTVEVVKQKKSLDKQAPGSKNTMDPLDILRN